MPAVFLAGIRLPASLRPPSLSVNPSYNQRFNFSQTLTLAMGEQANGKRPFCPSCSKPARLCLCSRFKNPPLDNAIAVTILQHSHEKTHPLNSTRIATLGLKNLNVFTVSDIHSQAQFEIRLLKPHCSADCSSTNAKNQFDSFRNCKQNAISDGISNSITNGKVGLQLFTESNYRDGKARNGFVNGDAAEQKFGLIQVSPRAKEILSCVQNQNDQEKTVITAVTCSLAHVRTSENNVEETDFDRIAESAIGKDATANGFFVKKLQQKPLGGNVGFEFIEEFEILIPPGSALLFPSKNSIGIETVNFEVKHLVVLDGTWAKARRMYYENPWLKLLPHLKLDSREMSLYSEVRHQPKAGCLSTIESIVYAMKGLGEDNVGWDGLLHVFESMVVDQRRCKDERLSRET